MEPIGRDVVIAGVNKAGTTSLFVSLSEHPDIAPCAVKESRFFLPARYGRPVEPIAAYAELFPHDDGRRLRLEATPALFYGGADVAARIATDLPGARIIVVLREPVRRTISFFEYQKTRLRIPADLSVEDYLAHADTLGPADFLDPENERWFAVGGSRYADFLPGWLEHFGPDRILVLAFEELTAHQASVLTATASWLGLDVTRFPAAALAVENRTLAYKSRRLQRVALGFNDRFERMLRRYPSMKRRLRAAYFRVNGRAARHTVSDEVLDELAERFREPNARLARQLSSAGLLVPAWLTDAAPVNTL